MISPYIYAGLNDSHNVGSYQMVENIKEAVYRCTGVSFEEIKSRKRFKNIVEARHLFHYFVRRKTPYSLKDIGAISKRDHASVIHSVNTIYNWLETDEEIKVNTALIGYQLTKINTIKNVATTEGNEV